MREFLGLTADEWRTVATFAGPTVAVILAVLAGVWRFGREQEAREVRNRYLVEGISRLKRNLNALTTMSLLNYQTANQLWRTFRDYPKGSPLEPEPDSLPALVPVNPDIISLEPVAVAQEVLGIEEVALWCAYVFSDASLATQEYDAQVRQPLLSYYRSESPPQAFSNKKQVLEQLRQLIDEWNHKATRHGQVYNILYDVETYLLKKGITRHKQIPHLKDDSEIQRLAEMIVDGYRQIAAEVEKERQQRRASTPASNPDTPSGEDQDSS